MIMKNIKIYLLVLFLALSCLIYADGNPAEQVEHREKLRLLDQLAEKFKAETGFRGEINYSAELDRLGVYEGKFSDIQITSDADTTAFRAVFEQILDKVLPYTFAKREQLSKRRITNNLGIIQTDYYQQINGYRVEGAGRLSIVYEVGRNSFRIGNGTVELPDESLGEIITEAEAYQIAFDLYKKSELYDKKYPARGKTSIFYSSREEDGVSQPYRLYWKVSFPYISYYVDALTKETFSQRNIVLRD